MTVFPPPAAVSVIVDGKPVAAYAQPYDVAGRVFAPVRPYVTRIADRVWCEGRVLVVQRDGRTVRIRLTPNHGTLDRAFVAIAPVLRALGERVNFDGRGRSIDVVTPARGIVGSEVFDPAASQVPPREVFTPSPIATVRPAWTGPARPRRTPIPVVEPTANPARRRFLLP